MVRGQSEDEEGIKTEELPGMFGVEYRTAQIRSQKGIDLGSRVMTSDM